MEIVTKGTREAKADLRRLAAAIDQATGEAVDDVLAQTEREARRQLSLGSHTLGTRTGSAPGSPPWRISGAMARAVRAGRARRTGAAKWSGKVGPSGLAYLTIQEVGGWAGRRHRSHLPARPYMKPAVRAVRPTVRRTFVTHLEHAVHDALR